MAFKHRVLCPRPRGNSAGNIPTAAISANEWICGTSVAPSRSTSLSFSFHPRYPAPVQRASVASAVEFARLVGHEIARVQLGEKGFAKGTAFLDYPYRDFHFRVSDIHVRNTISAIASSNMKPMIAFTIIG